MKKGMEGKGPFSLFHHIPFIHDQILLHLRLGQKS